MSGPVDSLTNMNPTVTTDVVDYALQAERYVQRVHDAVDSRVKELRSLVSAIGSASTLEELEEHESGIQKALVSRRTGMDATLDAFEDYLEQSEEAIVAAALDKQLATLSEEEKPAVPETPALPPPPASPGPSDLVVRLWSFLEGAEVQDPPLEKALQKLSLARTCLGSMRAQAGAGAGTPGDPVEAEAGQYELREMEDLSAVVVELALLVTRLKGPVAVPLLDPELEVTVVPETPLVEVDVAAPAEGDSDEVEQPSSFVESEAPHLEQLTGAEIEAYEEDYYRHVGLYRALIETATSQAHYRELSEFKALLDDRRVELSAWREDGGFEGDRPRLFADSYAGALPGESHVRGDSRRRSKNKRRGAGRAQQSNGRYTSAEVSQILRDFSDHRNRSRESGRPGRKGNFNGKIFLTSGQINPRANKRPGDW